jgi:hypothetical protein
MGTRFVVGGVTARAAVPEQYVENRCCGSSPFFVVRINALVDDRPLQYWYTMANIVSPL